jgi:fatty-acyl-CoA synthase
MTEIWISSSIFSQVGHYDRMYVTLPLYHTSGNIIGTSPWYTGGCVILRRKFSATNCFPDIKKYKATIFLYIGELIRYVMLTPETPEDKNHNLKSAFGNGLRSDVWDSFQKRFNVPRVNELYSSTEGNITLLNLGKPHACGFVPPITRLPLISIINPYWVVKYDVEKDEYIRDENGFCQLAENDEPGELLGRINMNKDAAAGNFAGYHNNPDASKKKILRDVFTKGDAYFRSGDLVKVDASGFFFFVDRIGDTYRWKGENIATGQVANVLGKFQGVQEANVYGVPVPGMEGKCGMVSLVAENLDFDGLYDFTTEHLTPYSNPYFLRIKSEFENTGTFKYRKVDLVKDNFDINVVKEPIYFRDDSQKKYVKVTKELYDGIMNQKVKF